jgi:primosomal protein N' (replication factor Y)
VSSSVIKTLESHGLLQVLDKEILRDPLRGEAFEKGAEFQLNADQKKVLAEIESALKSKKFDAFLLHGVTGSGKTEVYIRAMRKALSKGKSSLMLVPEISLTPIFSRRLRAHFGSDVAILHSSLSAGERFDEWRRIRNGAARIVIGTRSAIFAPLDNLGLIIIDEEHDTSYRQQESPFYNARDIAVVRAQFSDSVVVLGSATPALETYFNAEKGKYKKLHLPDRIHNRPLAKAELIDMRSVFKTFGKDPVFSPQLLDAIADTHAKGEQTIILLNRRGYSNFLLCRSCGETIRCKNCDISLTFHKGKNLLICHYCNFQRVVPKLCPSCESKFVYFIGEGTEKLEDILKNKFSDLRIARLDRDTASRRSQFEETILSFSERKIDLLVGTQMLAKGHDFPNVTLVGVVSVDNVLGLPDFRSAERTFQLLTQVAGRAGRGEAAGQVLIQTFYPEHYAIRHAVNQDYEGFYREEISFRKNFNYPPFVALASLIIHHKNYNYAFDNAQILREEMEKLKGKFNVRVLGVAPAPLARLKDEYRLQILVKAVKRNELREFLDSALHDARERVCDLRIVAVEIDPVSLM